MKHPILIMMMLFSAWLNAQTEEFLIPNPANSQDFFGNSMDAQGDILITGAYLDDAIASNAGTAVVFRNNGSGYLQEQVLSAPDGEADDEFGIDVAVYGNWAAVGAHFHKDSGAVYLFEYNGSSWSFSQELMAPSGNVNDQFGFSVALYNDVLAVGSFRDDQSANDAGAVYFFRNTGTWTFEQKVAYDMGQPDDFFGYSVDLDADQCIIGAYLDDDNGTNSGSAFIYAFDGSVWSQEQKLVPSNGASGDAFGFSVSIDGDYAVCGAYAMDIAANAAGVVSVWKRNGSWTEVAQLTASDAATDDWLGYSVDLQDSTILAGAFHNDDLGSESGSMYLFRYDGANWIEELNLFASDGDLTKEFAKVVAMDWPYVFAGSAKNNPNGTNSGSAYAFDLCTYRPAQQICAATVDTMSNQNRVFWNKPVTTLIDSFHIIRDGSELTAIPYDQPASYEDLSAQPNLGAYEYELITENFCGAPSDTSTLHRTIFLEAQPSGADVILNWTPAAGFTFPYYRIWRDDNGDGNYTLIFATLAGQLTFTDLGVSLTANTRYRIQVERGFMCTDGAGTAYNASWSNAFNPSIFSVDEKGISGFEVFPNPSDGELYVDLPIGTEQLSILDISGKEHFLPVQNEQDLSNYSKGVYILRTQLENGSYRMQRIVLN